jgi:hypothetical protein
LCHAACAAFERSKYLQVDAQLKCAEVPSESRGPTFQ